MTGRVRSPVSPAGDKAVSTDFPALWILMRSHLEAVEIERTARDYQA